MKFWITKYAFTKGIYSVDGEICTSVASGQMISGPGAFEHYHGEGREWHRTREAAVARANAMRLAKIKSLQKQLTCLQDKFV